MADQPSQAGKEVEVGVGFLELAAGGMPPSGWMAVGRWLVVVGWLFRLVGLNLSLQCSLDVWVWPGKAGHCF